MAFPEREASRFAMAGIFVAVLLGAGTWYYSANLEYTPIGNILKNPRDYEGKDITIEGVVTGRTSLVFVKYFKVKDRTGKIIVITRKILPSVGSKVKVKGRIEEAFSLGEEQMLVFVEENSGQGKQDEL
jgi:hypothetical protein